jgi:hypothetical protein
VILLFELPFISSNEATVLAGRPEEGYGVETCHAWDPMLFESEVDHLHAIRRQLESHQAAEALDLHDGPQ